MTNIRGSRALITGAASGIGRLLAAEMGKAGASRVLRDIDSNGLGALRDELRGAGCEADRPRDRDGPAAACHAAVPAGRAGCCRWPGSMH